MVQVSLFRGYYVHIIEVFLTILSALVVAAMSDDSELKITQSNSKFTTGLYNTLSSQSGNVFFSPLSAHSVLSLSYLGSSGSTEGAYVKSLGLPDKKSTAEGYKAISTKLAAEKDIALYLANKIYVGKDVKLKDQFSKAAKDDFNAEVENLDFAAKESASTINSWVEKKTMNKIKDMFSPDDLDQDTKVVLVNAIYFKGGWNKVFPSAATRTEPFYLNEKDKIDVQMMHQRGESYGYKNDDELNAKVLELPFENRKFSMVIILPNERDGIKDLETKLKTADLSKITDGLESYDINLALPKFKIETKMDLGDSLTQLGLGEIFSNGANFSDLLEGNQPLKVDKVIQKAFLEVNEKGAEAAAATGMVLKKRKAKWIIHSFLCDHPFVVLLCSRIIDNSQTILFFGRMALPSPSEEIIDQTVDDFADCCGGSVY